ncbi:MAG TPA: hypothetical protein VI757_06385 [Bacteroidia bacterium]|nr:hypothetical protein [Bacteroidia bacterium]
MGIAYSDRKSKRIYFASVLMTVAGILTGMEIFVRISSGIILIFVFILLIVLHPKYKLNLVLFLSGVFLTLLIYFNFLQPFDQYYEGIKNIIYLIVDENPHSASSIASKIFDSGVAFLIMIIYSLLASGAFALIIKKHIKYSNLSSAFKVIRLVAK